MSFSLDDIVQVATGSTTGTTYTATLPSGTTDGNTVIIFSDGYGAANPISSGFTRAHGTTGTSMRGYVLYKANVTAGENNFAVSGPVSSQPLLWTVCEVQNLHRTAAFDLNGLYTAALAGTTLASNTTATSDLYDGVAFAFFGAHNAANTTPPALSGLTGGFTAWQTVNLVGASTSDTAVVAVQLITDAVAYQASATADRTVDWSAVVVTFAAASGKRRANADLVFGAEIGTTAGHATGNATNPPFDFATAGISYTTSSPRTGSYALRLTGSAAIVNAGWTSTGAISLYSSPTGFTNFQQYVTRFSFRFPGSLPGSDVTLFAIDGGSGTSASGVVGTYRTASQKIGLQLSETSHGSGTEVLNANALVADTWYSIDVSLDMANAARAGQWNAYWQLDGVDQTTCVKSSFTASATGTFTQVRLGWLASTTATVDYDDLMGSKHPGHYPLGDIKVYPLTVDPAGTVTVTTAASFSTMTANGTINGTFSTTTARGAVDEWPPTIGASADGFGQDTTAATDYVELPMTTRNGPSNLEVVRGVRWYFPGWAASTTASQIGFRGFDGTTETVLFASADPNFDNSTTTPAWVCRMHRTLASATSFQWTQAKVDALTARVGFSASIAVVTGIHSVLAEVAMRPATTVQVAEQDNVLVYALLDPDSGNIVAYRLDATAAAGDAAASYTVAGTPVPRTAIAGTTDTYTVGEESHTVSYVTGGLQ